MISRLTSVTRAVMLGAVLGCVATSATANDFPSRPIRIMHGFAPGGAADTLSRLIAEGLSKRLGQSVVVEAKPGVGGNIAAEAVANAAPDGYTLGLVTGGHAVSAATYKALRFDPVDSFEMVSTAVYYSLVFAVRADHSAKTLADLIAMAKEKPGTLSFGSVGFGSTHHLAGELMKSTAEVDILHVPYRGDSQAITALLGGDVPMIVGTTVLLAQQIKGGTVRGLATTSQSRAAILPDVPSAKEAGLKGYDVRTWAGVIAPAGTPAEIVQKLNQAVLDTVQDPAIKPRLETAIGGEARGSTPAEMKQLVSREIAKWRSVVDKANLPRI